MANSKNGVLYDSWMKIQTLRDKIKFYRETAATLKHDLRKTLIRMHEKNKMLDEMYDAFNKKILKK